MKKKKKVFTVCAYSIVDMMGNTMLRDLYAEVRIQNMYIYGWGRNQLHVYERCKLVLFQYTNVYANLFELSYEG